MYCIVFTREHIWVSLLYCFTEFKVCGFVLFNATWSLEGHSVSCMTILSLNFQIARSDIRSNVKWAVGLVIAYGHFNLPQGFVWVYCFQSKNEMPLLLILP